MMRCIEYPKLFSCSCLLVGVGCIESCTDGASSTVSCPEFVTSYNAYMVQRSLGGVFEEAALRLEQRSRDGNIVPLPRLEPLPQSLVVVRVFWSIGQLSCGRNYRTWQYRHGL
jgi:hypothetical protein